MNVRALFGSKKSLVDWSAGWLKGGMEHTFLAVRNATGKASLSGTLGKSLIAVLTGSVQSAMACELIADINRVGYHALVSSHSSPGKTHECWMTKDRDKYGFPFGGAGNITYHVGILPILEALDHMEETRDFWLAYADLLQAFNGWGLSPDIKDEFLKAADELYFLLRYRFSPSSPTNDHFHPAEAHAHNFAQLASGSQSPFNLDILRDPDFIRRELGEPVKRPSTPTPTPATSVDLGGFKGWQGPALRSAGQTHQNILRNRLFAK